MKNRGKDLVDATRKSDLFTFASTRSQAVWNLVKAQVKTVAPELWHRLSSESTKAREEEKPFWPEDEEDALFCESLMGLMQRFKRYDFLEAEP